MKRTAIAVFAVLLAQPGIAMAGGGGKGGHGFTSGGHHHHHHKHGTHSSKWWWYYGYGGIYATAPFVTETVAVPVAVAAETVRPCQRVQQPITVRSEDGGERVISVTRCQN